MAIYLFYHKPNDYPIQKGTYIPCAWWVYLRGLNAIIFFIYLTSIEDFATVEVSQLPKDVSVEMDVVVYTK